MFKHMPVRQSISRKDLRKIRVVKCNASPNKNKKCKVQNKIMRLLLQLKISHTVSILIWNRTSQFKFVNQWIILHIKGRKLHNRSYHKVKLQGNSIVEQIDTPLPLITIF